MPIFKGFRGLKPWHKYELVHTETQQEKCCPTCGNNATAQTTSNWSMPWVSIMVSVGSAFFFGVGITLIMAADRGRATSSNELTTLWSNLILDKRPLTQIRWIRDDVFVGTDPHEGKWDSTSDTTCTPWDDIYRGRKYLILGISSC